MDISLIHSAESIDNNNNHAMYIIIDARTINVYSVLMSYTVTGIIFLKFFFYYRITRGNIGHWVWGGTVGF